MIFWAVYSKIVRKSIYFKLIKSWWRDWPDETAATIWLSQNGANSGGVAPAEMGELTFSLWEFFYYT